MWNYNWCFSKLNKTTRHDLLAVVLLYTIFFFLSHLRWMWQADARNHNDDLIIVYKLYYIKMKMNYVEVEGKWDEASSWNYNLMTKIRTNCCSLTYCEKKRKNKKYRDWDKCVDKIIIYYYCKRLIRIFFALTIFEMVGEIPTKYFMEKQRCWKWQFNVWHNFYWRN